MARQYVVSPLQKFWNSVGTSALSGGTLTFINPVSDLYAAIYRDSQFTVPQINPYPLDGGGSTAGDIHFQGSLTVVARDAYGTVVATIPSVTCFAIRKVFASYVSSVEYGLGGDSLVTSDDGGYYVSIVDKNINVNPTNSEGYWQQVSLLSPSTPEDNERISDICAVPVSLQQLIIGDADPKWSGALAPSVVDNYISGMITSNNALDANNDLDISAGQCNDSTNVRSIALSSAITKQLDATWSLGSGRGGRASGVNLIAGTWYHVFAVVVNNTADVMFDTSPVCVNGVANNGVTAFRRIGSIITTSPSATIAPYFQLGDYFYWSARAQDVFSVGGVDTEVSLTISAPAGVETRYYAHVNITTDYNGDIFFLATSLDQPDTTPSATNYSCFLPANASGKAVTYIAIIDTVTNTARQIRYRFTGLAAATTSASFIFTPIGWREIDQVRSS